MMMITRDRPIMMPGIQPPMNISPTEVPAEVLYSTKGMLGGMMQPRPPATVTTAVENSLE